MQRVHTFSGQLLSYDKFLLQSYFDFYYYEGINPELKCFVAPLTGSLIPSHNSRLTLLTFSICPPLLRVWQLFASASVKELKPVILIGDSSGTLRQPQFSGDTVIRHHLNWPHGQKIDFFIKRYISSDYVLLCDDDILLIDSVGLQWALDRLDASPKVAAVSMKPRKRFKWPINGQEYSPMGTYCLLFRRELFQDENLSFRTVHSPSPTPLSYKGEYDTADYANVELIKRGYEIAILPEDLQKRSYAELDGMSFPIVVLRRARGRIEQIAEGQHQAIFRSLYAHQLLREIYTSLGIETNWSILPNHREVALMSRVLDFVPAARWNELKKQVEETMTVIFSRVDALTRGK